jgi:hypothetical protein
MASGSLRFNERWRLQRPRTLPKPPLGGTGGPGDLRAFNASRHAGSSQAANGTFADIDGLFCLDLRAKASDCRSH